MKKTTILFFLCPLLTFVTLGSYSQTKNENIFSCGYSNHSKALNLNNLLIEESFVSNNNIENLVDKILGLIGLSKNFIIVSSPNLKNAYAVTNTDGIRYIVYDPKFVNEINKLTTNWSTLSILAHEIGHHLSGHTLIKSENLEEQRAKEIEADVFSGFIMYKLGASIYQAEAAMNLVASNDDDTYSTHPALSKRKLAISRGYEKAKVQDAFYKIDTNKSVEEYFNDATALYLSKQYFDAIKILEIVIKLNPNYFKAYHDLGFCRTALNDNFNAISNYSQAIRINPNYDRSYSNRGVLKERLKDYIGAIDDYNIAIKINPDFAIAFRNRGYAKQCVGQYKESIEDFTKAIKLQSNYSDAFVNRAGSKLMLKKFKDAISDCNEALKIDPYSAMAYFNRASAKGQSKDLSGMCDDLRAACKLGMDRACNSYNQYCN